MLIYDASQKCENAGGVELLRYLDKGVADVAPGGDFKEEDHPRGGKGSEEGGRFVKSEKTKRKEDEDVDNIGEGKDHQQKENSNNSAEEKMSIKIEDFCRNKKTYFRGLKHSLDDGQSGMFADKIKEQLSPEGRRKHTENAFLEHAKEQMYHGDRAFIPWTRDELKEHFGKVYKDEMTNPEK